ncbi:MAG: exosortase-associated EpsI family protein [Kordiimonadaceae bacterium]|nr:exosortase-associated EpsI family protein [Kordiimonadaceae bacterium]
MVPTISSSFTTDRWALLLLAFVSALMILSADRGNLTRRMPSHFWQKGVLGLVVLSILVGMNFHLDKLMIFAGVLLVIWISVHLFTCSSTHYFCAFLCLCFFVPPPSGVEATVGVWLAHQEASLFVAIGQFFSMPVYQFGPQIISGGEAVTVNSDCSGTLLFSPAVLGCLVVAATGNRSLKHRICITLAAVPIAFFLNLGRFAVLIGVNFNAPENIAAGFHDFLGWVVMPLIWLLPILCSSAALKVQFIWPAKAIGGGAVLIGWTAGALLIAFIQMPNHDVRLFPPGFLPVYMDGWVGRPITIPGSETRILGADFSARRLYSNAASDREILVTVMYHSDTRKAAQHSSQKCFEALGWHTSVQLPSQLGTGLTVENMTVRNYNQIQSVAEVRVSASALPIYLAQGVIRFQFVETNLVPNATRLGTVLQFLQAVKIKQEKAP